MFTFFRRHKTNRQVPEWASYFDGAEYERFLFLVERYFAGRKIEFLLGDGIVHIQTGRLGGEDLGLVNLAQICKQSNSFRWKGVIRRHFTQLEKAASFKIEFYKKVHDFSQVKDYIGVRLYHTDFVSHIKDGLTIGKHITEDIFALLVFDFPHSIINVQPEQTIQWNKMNEELFEIGIANIRRNYKTILSPQMLGKIKCWVARGNHFFAPNIVFDLKSNSQLVGSNGALIGIPHRHAVFIYPIENLEVLDAIHVLIPVIYRMNKQGPGSVSDGLFWYHNDTLTALPYELGEQKLEFTPPEAFVAVLNTLPAKQ
jgi:hypothetical protein